MKFQYEKETDQSDCHNTVLWQKSNPFQFQTETFSYWPFKEDQWKQLWQNLSSVVFCFVLYRKIDKDNDKKSNRIVFMISICWNYSKMNSEKWKQSFSFPFHNCRHLILRQKGEIYEYWNDGKSRQTCASCWIDGIFYTKRFSNRKAKIKQRENNIDNLLKLFDIISFKQLGMNARIYSNILLAGQDRLWTETKRCWRKR